MRSDHEDKSPSTCYVQSCIENLRLERVVMSSMLAVAEEVVCGRAGGVKSDSHQPA